MYTIEQIKQLIAILEDSELAVMEVSDGKGGNIRLEKPQSPTVNNYSVAGAQFSSDVKSPESAGVPPLTAGGKSPASDDKVIKAPMVGVFYAASSPESAPYVSVGQKVRKGDVLCIIEAMKLMNEITAEQSGTITEICVNNGDIVEFDLPLFKIK